MYMFNWFTENTMSYLGDRRSTPYGNTSYRSGGVHSRLSYEQRGQQQRLFSGGASYDGRSSHSYRSGGQYYGQQGGYGQQAGTNSKSYSSRDDAAPSQELLLNVRGRDWQLLGDSMLCRLHSAAGRVGRKGRKKTLTCKGGWTMAKLYSSLSQASDVSHNVIMLIGTNDILKVSMATFFTIITD